MTSDGRRQEIFASFERLVARYGLDRVTMRDLAREAGIAVGTIYLEFPSKDALVLGVEEKWLGHVEARNAEIVGSDRDPEAKIHAILVEHIHLFSARVRENRAEYELLAGALRLRYTGQEVGDTRRKVMGSMASSIAEVLEAGVGSGAFRVDDPRRTAALMVQAFGEFFLAPEVVKRSHAEVVEDSDDLFQLMMRAITADPPSKILLMNE